MSQQHQIDPKKTSAMAAGGCDDDEWVYLDGSVGNGKGDEDGGIVVLALTADDATEEDEQAYLSDYSNKGRLEKVYESDEHVNGFSEDGDDPGSNSNEEACLSDYSGESRLEKAYKSDEGLDKVLVEEDNRGAEADGGHKDIREKAADGGGGVDASPAEAAACGATNEHYDGGVTDLSDLPPYFFDDDHHHIDKYEYDYHYDSTAHLNGYSYGSGTGYNYGCGAGGGGNYGQGGGSGRYHKDTLEEAADDGAVVIDACPTGAAARGTDEDHDSGLGDLPPCFFDDDDHQIDKYEYDYYYDSTAHLDDYSYGSGAGYNYGFGAGGRGYHGHGYGAGRGGNHGHGYGYRTGGGGYHGHGYGAGRGGNHGHGYGAGRGGNHGHGYGYRTGDGGYYGHGYGYGEGGGCGYGADRYYAGAGLLQPPIPWWQPSYVPGVGTYPPPYALPYPYYAALPVSPYGGYVYVPSYP